MTDAAPLPAPSFTEENIAHALVDARGDLFIAAEKMRVTVRALDRAIRASEELQNTFLAIKAIKASREYETATTEQLEAEIARRMTLYRADALEALHELATGGAPDAGYAQVKLAAASRLLGAAGDQGGGISDLQATLNVLNAAYHKEAPRIKVLRESIEVIPANPIDVTPESP